MLRGWVPVATRAITVPVVVSSFTTRLSPLSVT